MRRLAAYVALLVAVVLAGCGGGRRPSPGPGPNTPVLDELELVQDSPAARAGIVYADEAALRRLAHAPASVTLLGSTQLDQRWFGLVGFGAPAFVAPAPQLPGPTGIDLFAADRSVTIGRPPHVATRLDGRRLDTGAVGTRLRRLGAKPSGSALALGREGVAHLKGPLGQIGIVAALDRVIVRRGTLIAGAYAADVRALRGDAGHSILARRAWRAAAICLGDVVAARIVPRGATVVATGVVRPAPHPRAVTGRICRVSGSRVARRTFTLPPSAPATRVFGP